MGKSSNSAFTRHLQTAGKCCAETPWRGIFCRPCASALLPSVQCSNWKARRAGKEASEPHRGGMDFECTTDGFGRLLCLGASTNHHPSGVAV
eukprot:s776_g2.t1